MEGMIGFLPGLDLQGGQTSYSMNGLADNWKNLDKIMPDRVSHRNQETALTLMIISRQIQEQSKT